MKLTGLVHLPIIPIDQYSMNLPSNFRIFKSEQNI